MKRGGVVRLLVSVRDAAEAAAALAGGADVIDVKEPARGAMGRADAAVIDEVVRLVAGGRPTSAALSELADGAVAGVWPAVDYVKIGLAGCGPKWREELARAVDAADAGRELMVVAYAEGERVSAPRVEEVVDWLHGSDAAGMLLDTAIKDGNTLFDHLDQVRVQACVTLVRQSGKIIALAGSLRDEALALAVALEPDIVAVRGAACTGGERAGRIDEAQVRTLARIVAQPLRKLFNIA